MLGLNDYFWRLIPANPILLRVVESGGKRRRDLFIRCIYLGLLVALVVFTIASTVDLAHADIGALAKASSSLFQSMSYLQLGLVALLAPIFTAGAITQEKDSQTYDILLATPLTNGQIVLGSLLSRLFFVIALLISGIPIFSITQIFGGVAIRSIVQSFGIAAATAFVTGALAMAIATFKVGTRRTIFSFYLFIVVYLGGMIVLDQFSQFHPQIGTDPRTSAPILATTSWLTAFNPFLALRTLFNDPAYVPPVYETLPPELRGWPTGWIISNPASFYTSLMFFLSFVLVTPSIIVLRRMAQSTVSLKTLVLQKLHITKGDRSRKPRNVWSNPIAWREAKTKASAARASLLRYGFIAAGIIGAAILVYRYSALQMPDKFVTADSWDASLRQLTIGHDTYRVPDDASILQETPNPNNPTAFESKDFKLDDLRGPMEVSNVTTTTGSIASRVTRAGIANTIQSLVLRRVRRSLEPEIARKYLLGAAIIEFAVILLIVTNAAASTVTREKEDGTLDLLLSSPITSRYYIWGKLRGLVSFVLPLVAVPVISVMMFVVYDVMHRAGSWNDPYFQWLVFPEAIFILPGMLIIVSAFAAILGMQMSLRCRTTVMAVMSSVGIVVGVCAAMGWCGFQFLQTADNWFALVVGSFSPFTLMQMQIDPYGTSRMFSNADDIGGNRVMIVFCSIIAICAYTALVWSMYQSMVKNFDMTIRKQSR